MKRLWMLLFAALLALAALPATALAEGNGGDNGKPKATEPVISQGEGDKEGNGWALGHANGPLTEEERQAFEEHIAEFREDIENQIQGIENKRLAFKLLRKITREALAEEWQKIRDLKRLMREQIRALKGLSPEERAQYRDDIQALYRQIRNIHRYMLEIRIAARLDKLDLFARVRALQTPPTEQEIENLEGALNGG